MSAIEWRDVYATGDPGVDLEHRQLIATINVIFDVAAREDSRADTEGVLARLLSEISAHFALEEILMREAKYQRLTQHKADHDKLLDELRDLMDAHADGAFHNRAAQFAAEVSLWFSRHFQTEDAMLHQSLKRSAG